MKKFLLTAPLALVSFAAAYSQAVSVNGGAIQGTITDPSGASVADASIVITSIGEGTSKTLTTDKSGFYSVGPLNPGEYKVAITAQGFQRTEVTTRILTGTATPGSFKLTVGQSSETVEVTTGDIQVNTDQAGVSDVITREQIASLPVNGRNFLDLAQIEPGVQLTNGNTFDPTKSGYTGISVNGTSGRTTRILLDGQDITDEFVGTTIFNVSSGAIAEFQLSRSTQDVAGEVTSQGAVQVSTRSGTNSIHGEAFYVFQDQRSLDANPNAIADVNGKHIAPYFQRNQYGGSVGFPIIKDKLFGFGNAERIVQNSASPSGLGSVFISSPIGQAHPTVGTPYRQTYSTARLDYTGPLGGHYFARGNYNVDSTLTAGGTTRFAAYPNRDNTFGGAFGADFAKGRFTHSFRGSYEKFHNLIVDGSQTSGYDPLLTANGPVAVSYSGQIYFGPNANAPQATYQSDKQLRYDGGYTIGSHNIRFGGAMNRIQSGAYAAFYGIAPRINPTASNLLSGTVTTANPGGLGCSGVAGAAACPGDPINGYNLVATTSQTTTGVTLGNGQGYSNNNQAFGLPGGGTASWRFSGYLADAWKVTPGVTVTAGLRYSVDTNRENNSIPQPTCADSSSTVSFVCAGLPGTTKLSSLWNPDYTQTYINQPYGNFGPQLGLVYSPGDHKSVIRAGFGLYYESVVFNNGSNAEGNILKVAPSFARVYPCSTAFSVTFPDNSVVTTSPDGTLLSTLCQRNTIAQAAPQIAALEKSYQTVTKANANLSNGGYLGNTLNASGLYAQPYRQPLSEQWNFGLQRELFKGAVISADYIHNMTWRIGQTIDLNHQGAARTFNTTYALAAINRLSTGDGCGTATVATSQAVVQCEISKGRSITNFASSGLDSSATYDGNSNWRYAKGDPTNPPAPPASAATIAAALANTPAAFPGLNPNLGSGSFIRPTGRSGYDALQIVYRQSSAHPAPGIEHGNFQVSYNLSRIVSNLTSSDQFFTSGAFDNDNPNQYIGRNGLDRKHELSFGGAINPKYGPEIGLIGHFFSAQPGTLTLDGSSIFTTDVTGDGSTGDVAPGTLPGDYMHRIKSGSLGSYVTTFNGAYAGKATPAGQAVVNSGLMSFSQLTALKGVIQPVAQLPSTQGVNNPMFRSLDVNFSYPIRFNKVHEGLSITPKIAFYNVGNFSNFANGTGTLQNTTTAGGAFNSGSGGSGFFTGNNNFATYSAGRTYRGVGTFSQGAPRQTEFQLTATF